MQAQPSDASASIMSSEKLRSSVRLLALLTVGFGITACSSTSSTKVKANSGYEDVAKVLATPNSIEAMPLLPPQEDVRIGDVYIMDAGHSLLHTPKWASLQIADAVNRHYAARPQFSQTNDEYFMESPDEEEDLTTHTPTQLNATQPRTILIGPMASIEGRDQFWRLVPPQVLALTLPPERRPNVEVAMRAGAAQSYSLPQSEVLAASLTGNDKLNPQLLKNLDLISESEVTRLFIVSEVIYARVISMGIRPRDQNPERRRWTDLFDRPMAGLENAAELNQQLREENLDDLPSGELRFLSVSDELILFRNTLEMPVAIGVRGISIDVETETGEVLQVALKHSLMKDIMVEAVEPEIAPVTTLQPKKNPSKLQPAGR